MYEEIRTAIEVVSAIICFILLRFMVKPYEITGEIRYFGLPLGFGFLGTTYVLSAVTYYMERQMPIEFLLDLFFIQLIARTFAFLFIAITYYFSRKPAENSRLLWKITLTLFIGMLITSFLILSMPGITLDNYRITRDCLRLVNLLVISYICVHAFKKHMKDPKTIWVPLGYIILLVSQYTALFFQFDGSLFALFMSLILRLVFLCIFLIVTFQAFYCFEKEEQR
jgi:hypothetical protein